MVNIVLFGPPGAGKGTQSENIISKYGLKHISTGDLFRKHLGEGTHLGKRAQSFMDNGKLVPDEVVIGMVADFLDDNAEAEGFIFDGFPRTNAQAEALDVFLESMNTGITVMLSLDVEEDELKSRLIKRAEVSGRADDADPKIIDNRIAVYHKETAPVKSFYEKQGKLISIQGMGSVDEITERLFVSIDAL